MQQRSEAIARLVARLLGDDDPWRGRILLAAIEGLQTQWLRDPSVDMVADLRRLYETLRS
jgi:hypothetical protein